MDVYKCIYNIILYIYSKTRNQKPAPKDSAASLSARVRKDINKQKTNICPDIHCGPHAP
jgi:hypothetical protein